MYVCMYVCISSPKTVHCLLGKGRSQTTMSERWEKRGIKIDGEYLSHLRFADDIIIFANSIELKTPRNATETQPSYP